MAEAPRSKVNEDRHIQLGPSALVLLPSDRGTKPHSCLDTQPLPISGYYFPTVPLDFFLQPTDGSFPPLTISIPN